MLRYLIPSVVAIVLLFSQLAISETIYVPDDYTTIQQAIDAAAEGDTVIVRPGDYNTIDFSGKGITVKSLEGPENTTIYSNGPSPAVYFTSDETRSSVISGFTITGCSGQSTGAIYIRLSGPSIIDNIIRDNNSAGVYAYRGLNPLIRGNEIAYNNGYLMYGCGIALYYCESALVEDNYIHNNHLMISPAGGAGIGTKGCIAISMIGNKITSNISNSHAGGIFNLESYLSLIERNEVTYNSGTYQCGGIQITVSNFCDVINNTVSNNTCTELGSGITIGYSNVTTLKNNIITGNSGGYAGIVNTYSLETEFDYADVWNNTPTNYSGIGPGIGCISQDPLFETGTFYLSENSPCIDAGDPDPMYDDPDGTRNDMGAYYFHQGDICLAVDMVPYGDPILVPQDSFFTFNGILSNECEESIVRDVWTMLTSPMGDPYGPVKKWEEVVFPAGYYHEYDPVVQYVPGWAPLGDYTYIAYTGEYPDWVEDSAFFYFTVTDGDGQHTDVDDWDSSDWMDDEQGVQVENYALMGNHPNPFNASTTISYTLPEASRVRMDIYNLRGQRIETLVDAAQQAGQYSVTWDASQVASGVYFYKLTAGKNTFTKKMSLLK
ncbi:MAG: T9SS type A sorting domain-containing protein [candidate division Zixibacteria bacterium]|nr:T9SS type A sorting domain-containing protein [candidate division Zixibacteria bacterium]